MAKLPTHEKSQAEAIDSLAYEVADVRLGIVTLESGIRHARQSPPKVESTPPGKVYQHRHVREDHDLLAVAPKASPAKLCLEVADKKDVDITSHRRGNRPRAYNTDILQDMPLATTQTHRRAATRCGAARPQGGDAPQARDLSHELADLDDGGRMCTMRCGYARERGCCLAKERTRAPKTEPA